MEFRFEQLGALHWLWGVLVLGLLVLVAFGRRRRALERFASAEVLGRLLPAPGRARRVTRAVLLLAALVALVAAMIDPRWGVTYQQVRQRGIDLVVVLDVSRSMLAEDARPSRLERAKQHVIDLLAALGGDRVALVTFAGAPSLRCPLTVDHGAFRLALDLVDTESAPRGGSLLGDALRRASDAFTDDVPDHKAIIVFTDGEDHGSYPLEAAQRLREERGVPVYTVALGDDEEGARIPTAVQGQRVYLTHDGQEVWSRMNGALLREIALATDGAYVPVGTGSVDMTRLYEERIAPTAKREFDPAFAKQHTPRFQWFAGLALLLLIVEATLGDRRATGGGRGVPTLAPATRRAAALVLLVLPLLATAPPAPPAPPAPMPPPAETPPASSRALLDAAREASAAGDHATALERYEALRRTHPDLPQIPYNMGVEAYRGGLLEDAAEHFREALALARDPALRTRSAYNLGTTDYARTLSGPPPGTASPGGPTGDPGGPAGTDMTEAMEALGDVLERYREALDADPVDQDARANAELAYRYLKQLEELQQQQQQQQSGDGEPQEQDPQDGQEGEQQQQQQPQGGEQEADSQEQGTEEMRSRQQEQSGDEDEQQQEQQQQQQAGAGEEEQAAGAAAEGGEQEERTEPDPSEAQPEDTPRTMTREEAERLLQSVRDKERQRREELARREAAKHPPVNKDW